MPLEDSKEHEIKATSLKKEKEIADKAINDADEKTESNLDNEARKSIQSKGH